MPNRIVAPEVKIWLSRIVFWPFFVDDFVRSLLHKETTELLLHKVHSFSSWIAEDAAKNGQKRAANVQRMTAKFNWEPLCQKNLLYWKLRQKAFLSRHLFYQLCLRPLGPNTGGPILSFWVRTAWCYGKKKTLKKDTTNCKITNPAKFVRRWKVYNTRTETTKEQPLVIGSLNLTDNPAELFTWKTIQKRCLERDAFSRTLNLAICLTWQHKSFKTNKQTSAFHTF